MKRSRRRLLSLAIVAATISISIAAVVGAGSITVNPRIVVIRHLIGQPGSGVVTLTNNNPMSFEVGSVTYSCGAAPAIRLAGGSGGAPFTLNGSGGTRTLAVECPTGLSPGMHRCTFTVRDIAGDPILDFLGACETDAMQLLAANPSALAFGNVSVGQQSLPETVVLANTSAGMPVSLLQLQVSDDNFLIGAPCQNETGCDAGSIAAGSSTPVDVICRPNTPGPHTGKLFVIGTNGFFLPTPIDLSCNGEMGTSPALTVTPNAISLTTAVEVNDPATDQATIQLQNGGSGSLTVTSLSVTDNGIGGAGADWSFTIDGQCPVLPCPLAGSGALNVRLTFDPSSFNSRPGKLIINYTDPGVKQTSANLDGIGQGATLELASSETVIDFGVVPLGTPVSLPFSLRNQGNRSTTASLSAPMPPFTFPSSVLVGPSVNPIVMVTCESSTPTNVTRTVNVSAGSDVTTPPFDLTLKCEVRDTLLTGSPTSLQLGEIRKDTLPSVQPFHISRVGSGAPVPLVSASLAPTNPNLTLGNLTAMQTPADVVLTIDPTMNGPLTSTITVTPMGTQPITIPISGTVVTASYTTPNVMSLGTFCVGQPTTMSTVALTSTGTGKIGMSAPRMQLSPSPFALEFVSPASYPAQLDPLTEATVVILPERGTAAGVTMDVLQWITDAGDEETTVTATYVADGGAIAPDSLSFGEVAIRIVTPNSQQVTLQNCDTVALELEQPSVPAPFVLDDNFPTLLEPGEKATFSIAFQPTMVGHFERELEVRSTAGGRFAVKLIGDGIAGGGGSGDDGGDGDLTSFYACSSCASSDPSGVLAIALAVMCAVVPRRRRRRRS